MADRSSAGPSASATPRLGVLIAGMGAISTTLIAGVEAVRQGLARPIGALTQLAMISPPDQPRQRVPLAEYLQLSRLDDLVFGGWDINPGNAYDMAAAAGVLEPLLLAAVKPALEAVEPMAGIHDPQYLRRVEGRRVKPETNKFEQAEALRQDIRAFKKQHQLDQAVVMWCGSTEVFLPIGPAHQSQRIFEAAMRENEPTIAPSMIYAYAALQERCGFVNATPTLTVDLPVMTELAVERGCPVSGKDLKTGQTLLKTILAPGIKQRMLGLAGWFSTNILGNGDGATLDDPAAFRSKEESKLSALNHILQPELYPELYGKLSHQVKINYYPPRGDNKESWDNIDLVGWLGYNMQIKINFLCRDSILAAPLLLDLALLSAAAQRAGEGGVLEWLGFYFKSPQTRHGQPEHDLGAQYQHLLQAVHRLAGRLAPARQGVRA
ncbi:MAG: inositol-3-phosphate synthase [Terriglobales bacterium]